MNSLFMKSSAVLSPCGLYRYRLDRVWDETLPPVCWVMLNPSTADADADDPTIRRCMGFAERWGYGGNRVVNVYALRSADPKRLWEAGDPVGPENDQSIIDACAGERTIVAWCTNAKLDRVKAVLSLLAPNALMVECLVVTKNGHPKHPLYVRGDVKPVAFSLAN